VPRHLLVVDDNPTVRRLIELTLEGENVIITAVNDGDDAIAAMAGSIPDIVLVDAAAAGRSGYDVASYMRQQAALAQVPVLMLAGAFEPIDEARAAAAGCAGVLTKPLEPQRLMARVKELLARLAVAAPVPVPGPAINLDPARSGIDELWSASFAAAPPAPPGDSASSDLEGYFDRLDRALTSRVASPPPRPVPSDPPEDVFAPVASPSAAPELDPDRIAEQAARLVLERLSDRIVRETVGEIVTERADRLIREEIDRIKSNIK
jgi:twitching motility two-component system response regulator PilG